MDQPTQKETRPPINLRIKFRSESVDQFIERYAVDVSRGGIFIRTRDPLAVGTPLKLDFQFQNGGALMSGDGTVVWIREVDPNRANVPPGMGVRFDKLTPESQAVLEQLLIEKAKRERSGVPGSGTQSGGGIAVRRPSSMFSVLDPQATTNEIATGTKPAPVATSTTAPVALPTAAAIAAALAAPKAAPIAEPKSPPAAEASAGTGIATPPPASAAALYRPLGTARNPFSAVTETGAPVSSVPSAVPASLKPAEPRTSHQAADTDDDADDAAPFDDMNDEPTQIAGRLPSFLTSDEEETTVGPGPVAPTAKETAAKATIAARAASVETGKGAAPEHRRLPGSVGGRTPLPERKTGTQAATPMTGTPARPKQSLDQAPPGGGEPNKGASRDTAQDIAVAGGDRAVNHETEKTPLPSVAAAKPGAPTPASSPAPTPSALVSPGMTAAPQGRPSAMQGAAAHPPTTVTAATTLGAPTRATAKATPAAAATPAVKVQPARKRSPAALIGVTVLVLGASSIFLFRFFGSHATEPVSPSSAPAGTVATGQPGTITGPPAVPPPEVTSPPSVPAPTGASADPTGSAAPAPVAVAPPEPAAAVAPAVPAESPTEKPGTAPSETAPDISATESGASGAAKKATKAKPPRGPRDTSASTASNAPPVGTTRPVEPAAAPTTAAPSAEAEATAHQIRITSKPAGADVTLDGQTIGKTPYSIGIADVTAPHFIAVRKDGFEPFEQMISASSTWAKSKGGKDKTALLVLKINAKLKALPGAAVPGAGAGAASGGGEGKPSTEPSAAEGGPASKVEAPRPDRPLPPSEAPGESPP